MTRDEFINDITTWDELIDVASEHGYDDLDNIIDSEHIRDRIQFRASDIDYGNDWECFANWVSDIPQGYDYYEYYESYDEYNGLDDGNFDEYKGNILDQMIEDGYMDCDEYEDHDEYESDELEIVPDGEDDKEPEPEEAFSVASLISMCHADIVVIGANVKREEQRIKREFDESLQAVVGL